jgi:hypothetical protein
LDIPISLPFPPRHSENNPGPFPISAPVVQPDIG